MVLKRRAVVTGAFSYSGQYIAKHFLNSGWEVITLTRNPERPHPLHECVQAVPLDFINPMELENNLRGADVLVITYWVRFEYPGSSFARAVENSGILFRAAKAAGVRRLVHVSVSNPQIELGIASHASGALAKENQDGSLPYYRGKAEVENLVRSSGLSYSILRPTIIFGKEEVLISNITWLLRHLPVFAIPGDGKYHIQPIYVEDLAELVVKAAKGSQDEVLDAGGPEVFTYEELIRFLAKLVHSRNFLLHLPPSLTLLMAKVLGLFLGDVILTNYELKGLMQERLFVGLPGVGTTSFTNWANEHVETLGKQYVNELKRHHGKDRAHG